MEFLHGAVHIFANLSFVRIEVISRYFPSDVMLRPVWSTMCPFSSLLAVTGAEALTLAAIEAPKNGFGG